MRVHIISAVFPPESMTSARMSADVADEMTRRGHEVTVFSPFPNRPNGKLHPGYRRAFRKSEQRNGYRIIHSWHTLSRRSTLISRTAENISFGLTSTVQLLREERPDVAYLNAWPLFAQWMNSFVLCHRDVPVVCAVKDLYPETYFSGPRGSRTPIARLAMSVDRQVYRQCHLVVPLNHNMSDQIAATRNVKPGKNFVCPDWVDERPFADRLLRDGPFRRAVGLTGDQFVAMYVGAMTRMAGLEIYLQAAEKLRHRRDIAIVLVGDGAARPQIEATIQQARLPNLHVVSPLDPGDVPQVQASADVLMLSLRPQTAPHATPSKLIYYLFSGRPILASVASSSSAAQIIRDAQCGYTIRQGDGDELAMRLEEMADRQRCQSEWGALGENARQYGLEHFSKTTLLPKLCDKLEQSARSRHKTQVG